MRLALLRSALMIATFLLVSSVSTAQTVYSPDVTRTFVSGYFGINHNTNFGSFRTDCDCNFEAGFGLGNIGAIIGADITYAFTPNWAVMAKLYYDNKHTKESYERELFTPISTGQEVVVREVKYKEIGDVSLSYLSFGLFARWQPRLARWYVFVGPTVGLPLSTTITHNQEIAESDLTYRELLENQREVSEASFEGDLRFEAMVGFGYDWIVRPRWYVNPEIRVGYPLTKVTTMVTDRGKEIPIDDWSTMSVQLSIGLKYEAF
jgi:hypothetical protein